MNAQNDTSSPSSNPDTTIAAEDHPAAADPATPPAQEPRWRQRLTRGRTAMVAGAAAAGLAIGGVGFGAGYAVASPDTDQAGITQRAPGSPPDGGGFRGPMDGGMGGPMGGQTDGDDAVGEAPDFDGDGEPDDGSTDTPPGSTQDSST